MSKSVGLRPWPAIEQSVKWHQNYHAYTFTAETLIGRKRVCRSVPVSLGKMMKAVKLTGNTEGAMESIFEAEVLPGFLEQVDAILNPPPKSDLEKAAEKQSSFASIEDSPTLGVGHYVDKYVDGGYPSDIDHNDLPYPPPDVYRIYRPEGVLGDAISGRLAHLYDNVEDWWLVEREQEVGHSEYTMEADYSYTVRVMADSGIKEHEFASIGKIVTWIEGEKK